MCPLDGLETSARLLMAALAVGRAGRRGILDVDWRARRCSGRAADFEFLPYGGIPLSHSPGRDAAALHSPPSPPPSSSSPPRDTLAVVATPASVVASSELLKRSLALGHTGASGSQRPAAPRPSTRRATLSPAPAGSIRRPAHTPTPSPSTLTAVVQLCWHSGGPHEVKPTPQQKLPSTFHPARTPSHGQDNSIYCCTRKTCRG